MSDDIAILFVGRRMYVINGNKSC